MSELEALRKQLREEQRLREAAERREQDAERLREEERRLREAAERREQDAERLREEERLRHERRTGKTTLPEFLDACHTHLYQGLTIQ